MDYLNQTIFFLYELCGLCPYISYSYLGLARPSSQGSYISCIARTGYRPCGAQKNENVGPLLKSKNFKMVTGNLSQAQDPLSTGSLCGCSGHVPMKLAWCTPLCDEALNVWVNCLRVVFFESLSEDPITQDWIFPCWIWFSHFPWQWTQTNTHDESEILILSEAFRSGHYKGIILVKHGDWNMIFYVFLLMTLLKCQ